MCSIMYPCSIVKSFKWVFKFVYWTWECFQGWVKQFLSSCNKYLRYRNGVVVFCNIFLSEWKRELFKSLILLNSLVLGYSGNADFLHVYNTVFWIYYAVEYTWLTLLCFNRMECLQALEVIREYFLKTFWRCIPKFSQRIL